MNKDEVLAAIGKLSAEDREDIRQTLNRRHANEVGAADVLADLDKEQGG